MTSPQKRKIYTRRGDHGETDLLGGIRVPKDAPRPEVCGTIDELNSALGVVRAEALPSAIDELLARLQDDLFTCGAELATVHPAARSLSIGPQHITALEEAIDQHEEGLPPLTQFILPGGTRAAAALHLARTICRRAERRLVSLVRSERQAAGPAAPSAAESLADLIAYLNRLGDLLFVLARAVNQQADRADVPWRKPL
jgi:cob(I)alamin adenosyltransferase